MMRENLEDLVMGETCVVSLMLVKGLLMMSVVKVACRRVKCQQGTGSVVGSISAAWRMG